MYKPSYKIHSFMTLKHNMSNRPSHWGTILLAGIWFLITVSGFANAQTTPSQKGIPVLLKIKDMPAQWPDSVPLPKGLVNQGGTKMKNKHRSQLIMYESYIPDVSEATSSNPGKDYFFAYAETLKQAGFKQSSSEDDAGIIKLGFERGGYRIDLTYSFDNARASKESIEFIFHFLK
jgi:hypothetical protein